LSNARHVTTQEGLHARRAADRMFFHACRAVDAVGMKRKLFYLGVSDEHKRSDSTLVEIALLNHFLKTKSFDSFRATVESKTDFRLLEKY